MLSLRLEETPAARCDAAAYVTKRLDARLAKRVAAGYFDRGETTKAARAVMALWRSDPVHGPPVELVAANAAAPFETTGGAVELFCRRLCAEAPTGRVRSAEELDACLRAVRVAVDGWRRDRAVAAALRRARRDLDREGVALDAWVAAAAADDGDVSRVDLRRRLVDALFAPDALVAKKGANALADAIASGTLPSLRSLYIDRRHEENQLLLAACAKRRPPPPSHHLPFPPPPDKSLHPRRAP